MVELCVCAEKQNGPKTINDLKLINAGKILENSKTLADSRVILGEIPGCVITMHVVLRPPTNDKASGTIPLLLLTFVLFLSAFV